MGKLVDMTGQRYGRLLVVERAGSRNNRAHWLCECTCGGSKIVDGCSLRDGDTTSCGCLHREMMSAMAKANHAAGTIKYKRTHGHSGKHRSLTYNTWTGMRQRCHYPGSIGYATYGAKGVTVCERWRYSFENFLADMGERKPGFTLDRVCNSKGYEPDNCRWLDSKGQRLNRADVRLLSYQGRTQSVTDWGRELGISPFTIYKRLDRNKWSVHRSLSTPGKVPA